MFHLAMEHRSFCVHEGSAPVEGFLTVLCASGENVTWENVLYDTESGGGAGQWSVWDGKMIDIMQVSLIY